MEIRTPDCYIGIARPMVDLLKPLKQQAAWIAAALLLLLGLLLPVSAQAHVHGHHAAHEAQATVHAGEASKPPAAQTSVEVLWSADASSDESGHHCANVCCSAGATCCASTCLMPLSTGLAARAHRAVLPPRILGGCDGTEPARLIEPPIGL